MKLYLRHHAYFACSFISVAANVGPRRCGEWDPAGSDLRREAAGPSAESSSVDLNCHPTKRIGKGQALKVNCSSNCYFKMFYEHVPAEQSVYERHAAQLEY
jgi:hypothetical protein